MACGNGWGQSPWGISPWGTGQGWGTGPWGGEPWGGCYVTAQPQPPLQTAGWERVSRYWEEPRRERIIRNVLFAVEGLRARARCGKAQILAGRGTWLRLRARRAHCELGLVEVHADSALIAPLLPAILCECGEVEVNANAAMNVFPERSSMANVGIASVRAVRNPTDEEILMMLAEIV